LCQRVEAGQLVARTLDMASGAATVTAARDIECA
jgi:xanthine dehydrogenase accessory factor